jgi:hypothetical protein
MRKTLFSLIGASVFLLACAYSPKTELKERVSDEKETSVLVTEKGDPWNEFLKWRFLVRSTAIALMESENARNRVSFSFNGQTSHLKNKKLYDETQKGSLLEIRYREIYQDAYRDTNDDGEEELQKTVRLGYEVTQFKLDGAWMPFNNQ